MNGILLCVILFVSLPLHVEDISLLHLTSPESQDNDKQDEGLSKQDALPDNPGQQVDAIPPAGGEEDAAVPEMDPASEEITFVGFSLFVQKIWNGQIHLNVQLFQIIQEFWQCFVSTSAWFNQINCKFVLVPKD
ncbi:uncharacterized protein LOC119746086 [Patiria miniata]|uniref:Uncharacterized protein n=1 Tax=Patiria miniata TaxID=46514 RepID=A0A914BRL4_PATMI|nr:uncharacterized protein LOC119746086 [Patiria miniata]